MPVSFGPIASGLPSDLVDKLILMERKPVAALEIRKAKYDEQMKLVQDLKGRIGSLEEFFRELGDVGRFRDLKVLSDDPKIITATADKEIADPAQHDIEVIEMARRASALSNGYPDRNESQVGVGYFSFDQPNGETKDVYVGDGDNTLDGLANLINTENMGIMARVVNDGSGSEEPWRLILSGKETGYEYDMDYPTFYFLDGDMDFYIDEERPATNAKIRYEGFELEFPSNEIKDLVPGVVFKIRKPSKGDVVGITITEDIEKIGKKVTDFLNSVNNILSFIQHQNKLTAESDTSRTLGGDTTLQTIESRLRTIFTNLFKGSNRYRNMSDLGIRFERNGLLTFDEKKFENALAQDFNGVAKMFIGDRKREGLIPQLKIQVNGMLQSGSGILTIREMGLRDRVSRIERDIENKERIIEQRQRNLRDQFSRLESSMAALKAQGQYLSSQIGGAPGGGLSGINLGGAKVVQ